MVGGKQTMTETVNVHNNTPTVYQLRDSNQQQEQRTLPPPAPDDEARKEIAALREALHALQEQKRTTPPLPSPEPPTIR